MITYVKGDLLMSDAPVLVNTVNVVGVMGKGIALQFKNAFPHNYQVYRDACRKGELQIGQLLIVRDCNPETGERLIIKFPTKTNWRLPSQYSYVEQGLDTLYSYLLEYNVEKLAMPAPGCGNGGLKWPIVKGMIDEWLSRLKTEIIVYAPI